MSANNEIWQASMRETRETLLRWNKMPGTILIPWIGGALTIAVTMLFATLIVAKMQTADVASAHVPFAVANPGLESALLVIKRNLLVLALHAFICIAGFMAMRALPQQALGRTGIDRWVHDNAGKAAMIWVSAATIFSVTTQVYALGTGAADISATIGVEVETLLLTTLPHALLELTAVFLPLAAFLLASRHKQWNELLAATVATVALALPILLFAAFIEAYIWVELLEEAVGR